MELLLGLLKFSRNTHSRGISFATRSSTLTTQQPRSATTLWLLICFFLCRPYVTRYNWHQTRIHKTAKNSFCLGSFLTAKSRRYDDYKDSLSEIRFSSPCTQQGDMECKLTGWPWAKQLSEQSAKHMVEKRSMTVAHIRTRQQRTSGEMSKRWSSATPITRSYVIVLVSTWHQSPRRFLAWERKLFKWMTEYVEKLMTKNKHSRWFHSSLEKLPFRWMSASWFLVSTYLIWIFGCKLILSNNQFRATLWVLDTCLVIGLLPLIIILITASLLSKMLRGDSPWEERVLVGTWSTSFNWSTFCFLVTCWVLVLESQTPQVSLWLVWLGLNIVFVCSWNLNHNVQKIKSRYPIHT